jgi:hypothetical protein
MAVCILAMLFIGRGHGRDLAKKHGLVPKTLQNDPFGGKMKNI